MLGNNSRRKAPSEVTPLIEDSGLFVIAPMNFVVDLIPRMKRNSRDDLVIKGFLSDQGAIDVVIAGRRKEQAQPLVSTLQNLWSAANERLAAHIEAPEAESVRLQTRVLGSWRRRYEVDDEGWQTHEYQLLLAQWAFSLKQGVTESYGISPVLRRS